MTEQHQEVVSTATRAIDEAILQGPCMGTYIHKPFVKNPLKVEIKKMGNITASLNIEHNRTFIKIKTYDHGFILFLMNHFTQTEINSNSKSLTLVLGDQRISSYINKDGYAQHSITLSPTLMIVTEDNFTSTKTHQNKKVKTQGIRLFTQIKDNKQPLLREYEVLIFIIKISFFINCLCNCF